MKKWIVRFATLYVFNLVVLLVIDLLVAGVSVGWALLWASVVLTAAVIWLKPLIHAGSPAWPRSRRDQRTKAGEKLVQIGLVFVVELLVWVVVVLLSGVTVHNWFLGYLLPPIFLLIAWAIYDAIDDRLQVRAGALYDERRPGSAASRRTPRSPPSPSTPRRRRRDAELQDGLTAEQRRMLDELGKS